MTAISIGGEKENAMAWPANPFAIHVKMIPSMGREKALSGLGNMEGTIFEWVFVASCIIVVWEVAKKIV